MFSDSHILNNLLLQIEMKKSLEISVHLFFWVIFTAFVFMLSKLYLQAKPDAPFGEHLYYVVFLELIMGLIFFYTTYFGIPWTKKRNINLAVLIGILLILLIFFAIPAFRVGFWEVMSSIIPHIIVIFLALIFRRFSDVIRLEQQKQNLHLQNINSELALLKMQISPHFLFNTLNNIDYLIINEPSKASDAISKLGEVLRYLIYETSTDKIPLANELTLVEDYISLIRLRTAGTNYLKYNLTGEPGYLQIAPMLFFPLIENAYKHASRKEGENVITFDLNINRNMLNLQISNEYDSFKNSKTSDGGLGLNIVKRRLELIYPGRHQLKFEKGPNRHVVDLTIELDEY